MGGLFFYEYVMFYFISVLYVFRILFDYRWLGILFYGDSCVYILMVVLRVFRIGLVIRVEWEKGLVYLSQILIYFCVIFFLSSNFISLYVFYEISMFPILIIILGYGSQVEKVGASYYLLFYTIICSFPFLYLLINRGILIRVAYCEIFLSWEFVVVICVCFLVKFPMYGLHL